LGIQIPQRMESKQTSFGFIKPKKRVAVPII
jgi:hypothetical protein